jgi:hypothetical protein
MSFPGTCRTIHLSIKSDAVYLPLQVRMVMWMSWEAIHFGQGFPVPQWWLIDDSLGVENHPSWFAPETESNRSHNQSHPNLSRLDSNRLGCQHTGLETAMGRRVLNGLPQVTPPILSCLLRQVDGGVPVGLIEGTRSLVSLAYSPSVSDIELVKIRYCFS